MEFQADSFCPFARAIDVIMGDLAMDANYTSSSSSMVDTTDSLEAVGVFRGWKNFLFIIVLLCLFFVQTAFWLVNLKCVDSVCQHEALELVATIPDIVDVNAAVATVGAAGAAADANEPASGLKGMLPFSISAGQITWALRFVNCVLVFAAVLYCMSLLFGMKVTLMGRLGGINQICRAFFLSMIMVILLLPWQQVFGPTILGAIFTSSELFKANCAQCGSENVVDMALYYLRFTGYWLLMLLLLIVAQVRGARWTNAIYRRLEVL